MRQSELFTKTSKTSPKDEEAINAKLLIRAGFIRKSSAGVYSYLPLGWRVIEKINGIIREEMNAIGAQELLMPALVHKEYWEKSGRWDSDVMFKIAQSPITNHQSPELGLGWTHEEVITHIATNFINSYQDLPLGVYQIQTKFRAEPRAKNGLLRGREFSMKDLYSFNADKADLDSYYKEVIKAYEKILKRLGLKFRIVEASGGQFTKEYTHEFQVLNPAGEDTIFYCTKCDFSQNKEISKVKAGDKCPKCSGTIEESAGIEVANVFKLGTRYSEPFDLTYTDVQGKKHLVVMGSYGIGPSRLMGTLVEVFHDEKGIIWPEAVAPFQVHLIYLPSDRNNVKKTADKIYNDLSPFGRSLMPAADLPKGSAEGRQKTGVQVLYDDREKATPGEKFADADLIGIPYRAVVSEKTVPKIEIKRRNQNQIRLISPHELISLINK